MSSPNTKNNIYIAQNEPFLLKCLLAQRNEYKKAKKLSMWKNIVMIVVVLIAIAAFLWGEVIWLQAVSGGLLPIFVLVGNKYFDESIQKFKEKAADIQQYIDVTLYNKVLSGVVTEWGAIIGTTDIADSISEIEGVSTLDVQNWYSDYSTLPAEKQIFYCQLENTRWNRTLQESYKSITCWICVVVALVVLIALFVINPQVINAIYALAWITPIIDYAVTSVKESNESIKVLQKLENRCKELERQIEPDDIYDIKKDLIDIQQKIYEARKSGVMIPEFFYHWHKKRYQQREDAIAKEITQNQNN